MSCPGKVIKYIYFKIHVWTFLYFWNQSKRDWSRKFLTFFDAAAHTRVSEFSHAPHVACCPRWMGAWQQECSRILKCDHAYNHVFREGRDQSAFASFGGLLSKNESGDVN